MMMMMIGAFLMPYNGSRDFLVHLLLTLKATFMAYIKGVSSGLVYHTGASIAMGQGEHVPNIYEGGTSMVMPPPQYFRSDVVLIGF